jgi:thioredoxin reductase
MSAEAFDAIVVGGGPAGLSAGFWLGRYQRRVVIFDNGEPRNEPAWAVHGFPGLPDPLPSELKRRLLNQAQGAGAEVRDAEIVRMGGQKDTYTAETGAGEVVRARRVVLAYGLRELYGTSVFHCPDCDGPANAGARIGVIGWDRDGAVLALYLRHWSSEVSLLTHGRPLDLTGEARGTLHAAGIDVVTGAISRVTGHGGNLTQAEFAGGETARLDAIFFHLGSEPRCDLAQQLHCELDDDGFVRVDRGQETSSPGVHAAGDITGHPHLAAIAAAEGIRAALAIHRSLLPQEYQL